jgi:tetratricopeptide (TPR) repeat protein
MLIGEGPEPVSIQHLIFRVAYTFLPFLFKPISRRTRKQIRTLYRDLAIREETQGPDHPEVAQILEELAKRIYTPSNYVDRRKRDVALANHQALKFRERALKIREENGRVKHTELYPILKSLAVGYQALCDHESAQPLFERALEIQERIVGREHLEVVQDLYALADLYRAQEKPQNAERLLKRVLAINEHHLAPEHPDVAKSHVILAWFYDAEKEFDKAERLLRRSLEIDEKNSGADSYDVAISLEELAGLYIAMGNSVDAKPLLDRALAIKEKYGGSAANSLGDQYIERWFEMFDYDPITHHDAEPLLKRAIAVRELGLGKDHWRVAETLDDLAQIYNLAGRRKEAKEIESRAKAIWVQHGGREGALRAQ